jgi:hypothetical protein
MVGDFFLPTLNARRPDNTVYIKEKILLLTLEVYMGEHFTKAA